MDDFEAQLPCNAKSIPALKPDLDTRIPTGPAQYTASGSISALHKPVLGAGGMSGLDALLRAFPPVPLPMHELQLPAPLHLQPAVIWP